MRKLIILTIVALLLFGVNVSAEGKVHNVTIVPSATTLSAGETLSVEIVIDNTENICGIGYSLKFDPNVFSVNTENYLGLSDVPQFVDKVWYDSYNKLPSSKTFLINSFTYYDNINVILANVIGFSKGNSTDNMTIGKFALKVKEGVSIGATSLSLVKATTVDDFNSVDNIPQATIASNDVTVEITEKETIEEMIISGDSNINTLNTVNIASNSSKPGKLFVAAYKLIDGREVLISASMVIVSDTDYQSGKANINTNFKIPSGATMVKSMFWSSSNIDKPINATQKLN